MTISNKGGRPPIKFKKSYQLSTRVTLLDKKILEQKAKQARLTMSEYLRHQGIVGNVNVKVKTLPADVLKMKGTLNHIAANINQIAYQLNSTHILNSTEFIQYKELIYEIKDITKLFKEYLKND